MTLLKKICFSSNIFMSFSMTETGYSGAIGGEENI